MNKKGFAISGMIYSILILFLIILSSFLMMMSSRKIILERMKKDVLVKLGHQEIIYDENSYLKKDLFLLYDSIINFNKINNGDILENEFIDLSNDNNGELISFDVNSWNNNHLKFDGISSVVQTGINAADFGSNNDDFTMSILVKINEVSKVGNQHVDYDASTIFGGTYYSGYGIIWNTNCEENYYNIGTMMRNSNESSTMFFKRNYYGIQHLTFVYNSSQNIQAFYIDGVKVLSKETIPKTGFSYPVEMDEIKIGGSKLYGGNARNVKTNMNLYTAKIYTRALSEAEVKLDYNIDKYRYNL